MPDGLDSYLDQFKQSPTTNSWWTPERIDQAVNHLTTHAKLSPVGAQGLVSRWANVEARGGPNSVNPNSKAYGIGQWLGSRKNGVPNDFEGQLNHAVRELNTTESKAAQRLRNAQTPEDAATGASMFERAEGYNPKTGRDNFTDATVRGIHKMGYKPTGNGLNGYLDQFKEHTPQTNQDELGSYLDQFKADGGGANPTTPETQAESAPPVATPPVQQPVAPPALAGASQLLADKPTIPANATGGYIQSKLGDTPTPQVPAQKVTPKVTGNTGVTSGVTPTSDADFNAANESLAADGKPTLTREQFDTAVKQFKGSVNTGTDYSDPAVQQAEAARRQDEKVARDISFDVPISAGQNPRDVLKQATIQRLSSEGINASSEDIEAAYDQSPLVNSDGTKVTDTELAEYAKSGKLPVNLSASFIQDVLKAKQDKLARGKQSILVGNATGDLEGGQKQAANSGLTGEDIQNILTDPEFQTAANKAKITYESHLNSDDLKGDPNADILARQRSGFISDEQANKQIFDRQHEKDAQQEAEIQAGFGDANYRQTHQQEYDQWKQGILGNYGSFENMKKRQDELAYSQDPNARPLARALSIIPDSWKFGTGKDYSEAKDIENTYKPQNWLSDDEIKNAQAVGSGIKGNDWIRNNPLAQAFVGGGLALTEDGLDAASTAIDWATMGKAGDWTNRLAKQIRYTESGAEPDDTLGKGSYAVGQGIGHLPAIVGSTILGGGNPVVGFGIYSAVKHHRDQLNKLGQGILKDIPLAFVFEGAPILDGLGGDTVKALTEKLGIEAESSTAKIIDTMYEKGKHIGFLGAVGGGQSALEGGDRYDIAKNAALMASLGLTSLGHKPTEADYAKLDKKIVRMPDADGKPMDVLFTQVGKHTEMTDVTGLVPDGVQQAIIAPKENHHEAIVLKAMVAHPDASIKDLAKITGLTYDEAETTVGNIAQRKANAQTYFNKDASIQAQKLLAERRGNVTVPETGGEQEGQQYSSVIDEIRQKGADTKAKIKAIFPHLTNEEAADYRRQAFPDTPTEPKVNLEPAKDTLEPENPPSDMVTPSTQGESTLKKGQSVSISGEAKGETQQIVSGKQVYDEIANLPKPTNESAKDQLDESDVKNKTYVRQKVNIADLVKSDVDLKDFVENNPATEARSVDSPIVIGSVTRGAPKRIGIVDGMHRIAQAIKNGDTEIDAYVERPLTQPTSETAPEAAPVEGKAVEGEATDGAKEPTQIVDDKGQPLTVHHVTSEKFDTFKPTDYGERGQHSYFYFAGDPRWTKHFAKDEFAQSGRTGNVRHGEYNLDIKKPLDLRDKPLQSLAEWKQYLSDKGFDFSKGLEDDWTHRSGEKWKQGGGRKVGAWQLFRHDLGTFRDAAIKAGYDGIVMPDVVRGKADNTTYVAFHPEQIAEKAKPPTPREQMVAKKAAAEAKLAAAKVIKSLEPDVAKGVKTALDNIATQRTVVKPEAQQDSIVYRTPKGEIRVVDRNTFEGTKVDGIMPKGEKPQGTIEAIVSPDGKVTKPPESKPVEPPKDTARQELPPKFGEYTRESADAAKDLLKKRLAGSRTHGMGAALDDEMYAAIKEVAGYHIKNGVKYVEDLAQKVADEIKDATGEVSDWVKPHVEDIYKAMARKGDEPPPVEKIPVEEKEPNRGTSKIGKSIETKAIEKGLTQSFDTTAAYDKKTVADQKARVAELVTDDARRTNILKGIEKLPPEINPSMFIDGVERYADAVGGDKELQIKYDLANSNPVVETSIAGQTLRFAQEREQDSFTNAINEIRKSRQAEIKKVLNGRTMEQAIQDEAQKLAQTIKNGRTPLKSRQTWNNFLDSIQC